MAEERKKEITMQYLLLIYENEQNNAKMSKADGDKVMQEYFAFTKDIQDKKNYVAGEALQPIATATTVRVRDGKTVTTDGPFAETREQLGGYYLVEAKDLDEARSIAARIPAARTGSIEVRPVVKFT
ncbi:MAG TPA: YciI family protein [Polyangiaceae bacterium]|nr:YciI family protein [Polyangiaceae bacterium]